MSIRSGTARGRNTALWALTVCAVLLLAARNAAAGRVRKPPSPKPPPSAHGCEFCATLVRVPSMPIDTSLCSALTTMVTANLTSTLRGTVLGKFNVSCNSTSGKIQVCNTVPPQASVTVRQSKVDKMVASWALEYVSNIAFVCAPLFGVRAEIISSVGSCLNSRRERIMHCDAVATPAGKAPY